MRGSLKALWFLGFALVATLFRSVLRGLGRGRPGIDVFQEQFETEGLSPVSPAARDRLPTFGNCIACGICDRGEGDRIRRSGGAYHGVQRLMLASSKSMPDFPAVAASFRLVPPEVLEEKEELCPARVPMRAVRDFVLSSAERQASD